VPHRRDVEDPASRAPAFSITTEGDDLDDVPRRRTGPPATRHDPGTTTAARRRAAAADETSSEGVLQESAPEDAFSGV